MPFADLPFSIPGDVTSWIALATSLYSVWQTALKRADLVAFVPPTIRYASPYQNTNLEMFEVPVTVLNQGARSGTILAMELTVEKAGTGQVKRFYAAGLDQWSLEAARSGFKPFMPVALAGRTSRSRTVLFQSRNEETIAQVVAGDGDYKFTLSLETALARDSGILARLFAKHPKPLGFAMRLPYYDARAFTSGNGTLPLHQRDYKTSRA